MRVPEKGGPAARPVGGETHHRKISAAEGRNSSRAGGFPTSECVRKATRLRAVAGKNIRTRINGATAISPSQEFAGQRLVRQTDLSSAEAVGYLQSADFSPNSAGRGLRTRPARSWSIAPVYAICVNKTQIDNVTARPCRRLALAIDLHVTPLTGTANDQFRSALGREVNRRLRR
jgi:hypothetical protein